jgi:glycosyltransferase involved in cell wall biosynthesis
MEPTRVPAASLATDTAATSPCGLRFSLVVPLHNEQDNVDPLLDELCLVLPAFGAHELICVDDGSTDGTVARLVARRVDCPALRVMRLDRNRGQSAALMAGFAAARAPLLLMIDGDLQNDPRDLGTILDLLADHDAVSGWRQERRDNWLRRLSSRLANGVRNLVSGDRVIDSASGIKGFRAELVRRMPRFHGMHRFLPTLARLAGGTMLEVPVNHRPRRHGRTKYGVMNRAWRAFVDLLAVRWLRSRYLDYAAREERE